MVTRWTATSFIADRCALCRANRDAIIDERNGEYLVTLPTQCASKGQCEREIMRGFAIAPVSA